MAATTPPRTRVQEPLPAKRGPHRVPSLAKALIASAGLMAVVALALTSGKGLQTQTAADAPTPPASTAQPTPTTPTPPPTPAGSASLADEATAAQKLAKTYRDAATTISQKSTTAPLKSSNAPLVAALQKTASAYDAAATAAVAGDIAGYMTAMTNAEASRQDLSTLLNGAPGGGLPAPSPSPPVVSTPTAPPAPANTCAGDSQSDDPSDDSCGEA
jgi:hypothetical protein